MTLPAVALLYDSDRLAIHQLTLIAALGGIGTSTHQEILSMISLFIKPDTEAVHSQ